MDWGKLLFVIGGIGIAFLLYRTVRGHPEWFSSSNLQNSFFTLGILAIILIVFIGTLVLLLKSS